MLELISILAVIPHFLTSTNDSYIIFSAMNGFNKHFYFCTSAIMIVPNLHLVNVEMQFQTSPKSIINLPSFPPQHHFPVNFRQPPSPFSPLPSHIFLKNKNQTFHLILISSYIPFSSPFPRSSIFTFSRHLLYLFDQAPAFSHMKTARSTKT